MRYFLTDLRGDPIYSFSNVRRIRRSTSSNNSNSSSFITYDNSNTSSININIDVTNNSSNNTRHHYQSSSNYIRQSSYSQQTRRSTSGIRTSATHSRRGSVTTGNHCATLFCLVLNRAWNDVIRHVERYPNDVWGRQDSVTGTGNTALHVACRLDPPASVIYALQATCRTPNADGATPLHVAASHRCSAAALDALLTVSRKYTRPTTSDDDDEEEISNKEGDDFCSSPTGVVTTTAATSDLSRMGRAPIHYACMSFRGLDIDAFRLLLDATLKEGNLWMEKPQPMPPISLSSFHRYDLEDEFINEEDDNLALEDDEDDGDVNNDETSLYDDSSSHSSKNNINVSDENCDGAHDGQIFGQIGGIKALRGTNCHNNLIKTKSKYKSKMLVNVMGLKDATGQTPLALLFRRYRERVRCVIITLDKLRREMYEHDPTKMALCAALTVHSDLGQLWEKARFIVARLTEERLAKDEADISNNLLAIPSPHSPTLEKQQKHRLHGDSSSDDTRHEAFIAAQWATEQQQYRRSSTQTDTSATSVDGQSLDGTVTLPLDDTTTSTRTSAETLSSENDGVANNAWATSRQFRIVHASVGLTGFGCPPELIRLAISIYPHQVMEMDEDGNLPIHIAVTAASHLAPTMVAAVAMEHHYNINSDDHSILSDAALSFFSSATVSQTTNSFDKVIKMLLQHYPQAARIPHGKNGQLPLVMAVECGRRTWEDGLRTLLNAYPPALHNKKLIESAFYPNILALIANSADSPGSYFFDYSGQHPSQYHHRGMMLDFLPFRRSAMTGTSKAPPQPLTKQQRNRHKVCARTTLFELLRTKPEWITKGWCDGFNVDQ